MINKKRGTTPSMALRLSKFFGTSADLWMNLHRWDLYQAALTEADELRQIKRFRAAS